MTDRSKTDAHERRFPNTAALFETLARDITDALQAGLASGRGASLIVPGGRTPVALFELLSGAELDWDDVWISVGDERWVDPGNLYSTRENRPLPGLNVYIRQPIPGFGHRIEVTADLRNLLAQGYLGLNTAQNQRVLLVENPRSIRGGLSFIF